MTRCIYIGTTVLGYPEKDVWKMTVRKLLLLYQEHQKYNGTYEEPATLDTIF